jgi:pyruvate formate lyase activating enzyme
MGCRIGPCWNACWQPVLCEQGTGAPADTLLGFQPLSLLDDPPFLAAVLFFPGCNLRCPWCHNPDLLEMPAPGMPGYKPWSAIYPVLTQRRNRLNSVVFSGGEALGHHALRECLVAVKALGYRCRLDTNGTLPEALAAIPATLVDAVAFDFKLGSGGNLLQGQLEALAVLRYRWPQSVPRLVWVPGWHGPAAVDTIVKALGPKGQLRLQGFRSGRCLDPALNTVASLSASGLAQVAETFRARGVQVQC